MCLSLQGVGQSSSYALDLIYFLVLCMSAVTLCTYLYLCPWHFCISTSLLDL